MDASAAQAVYLLPLGFIEKLVTLKLMTSNSLYITISHC